MVEVCFFIFFLITIFVLSFYWLFANAEFPLVLGMPYGMFFVVIFMGIEFVALLGLYWYQEIRRT